MEGTMGTVAGDKRQYRRFKVRDEGMVGRLNGDQLVDIIDLSVGGVALNVRARLVIGRDYVLRLHERGSSLDVSGTVVRSRVAGRRQHLSGHWSPIYASAMRLREGMEDQVADFICDALLTPGGRDTHESVKVITRQIIDG